MFAIKRILMIIPTLFILSVVGFMINKLSPGDPVEQAMGSYAAQAGGGSEKARLAERAKQRKKFGLDLPVFYVDLSTLAAPDTLYKLNKFEKEPMERLLDMTGNWDNCVSYYSQLKKVQDLLRDNRFKSLTSSSQAADLAAKSVDILLSSSEPTVMKHQLLELNKALKSTATLNPVSDHMPALNDAYKALLQEKTTWKNYVPALRFYSNNQYHRWLFGDGEFTKGVIRGDFGLSYANGRPVSEVIWERLFWSLLLTFLSMIIAYAISIPIGVYSAIHRGKMFDKVSGTVLYTLYAMPSFWLAIILMMAFANPKVMDVFPPNGVKPIGGYSSDSWWVQSWETIPFLILPLICYTYGSIAFLSKSVRASYLDVMNEDFMKTARSKGLSTKTVIFKHGLRNALLPLITIFPNIFPAAISGAVILEVIFGIPGMGSEIYKAVQSQDYPMIQTVILLSGFVTMLGYVLSDLLYMIVDPRIDLKK